MRYLSTCLLFLAPLAAQHDMIGVDFNGQSWAFDSRTGAAVLLTSNALSGQNAMARVGNSLFSTDRVIPPGQTAFTFSLGVVSPQTGNYARTRANVGDLRGLAEHPSNGHLLFGILQGTTDVLVTVDTTTGAVTTIGSTGRSGIQALCLFQGQLLAWDIGAGLMRINQQTGLATDVNPAVGGSTEIQFLTAHRDGRLLGGNRGLFEIDPVTGASPPGILIGNGALDLRGAEERMPLIESFGTGCNTVQHVPAQLTVAGGFAPSTLIAFQSTLHEANHFGALVIGFDHHGTLAAPLPHSLDFQFGTSGCTLYETLDLLSYGFTDGTGRLAESFTLPPFTAELMFFAQHVVFETVPGSMSWSSAVMVKVGT
jgi:hypothetical protein